MPASEIIHQLVERFEENRDAYRSGKYNEMQLREEFLNPFFEVLGWDIYNKKDYSPEYREVVHEDSIEIEGASKAPDYCFRIGKERKFFVEAKKPAVNIEYDIHPAYQLRRYAWNAHLPLSILTDFEEFAVYDCRNRPNQNDKASSGRVMFLTYKEYVEKWDEIAGIFSPEAIQKGSFEKYAIENRGKKGTTEVDDAFLEDIENWRKLLALNIALRNLQVADDRELNFAVQITIDRIIFLRICEDRGIEPEEQLLKTSKKPGVYFELMRLFQSADHKYNSGLFHFKSEGKRDNGVDSFTPNLTIDDKTLKEIIKSIYYPCPYIFKEIPVEILGQVYEQFLGKVIHLTAGHQARVEEKPEVRKAGGVYYTPAYIVDYIVQNTVGKLLEGKTPTTAASLKIVDPACGSGSFLLGAFQYLIDWHENWYIQNGPNMWAKGKNPALMTTARGGWKLTTSEKKKILLNNIHGVDIDAQAVEVTKLSLLLKVLEEESGQLSLGLERVLPDLGKNIQCGNSLIGEDYFEGRLVVDEDERQRVNPFEWKVAFPNVFAQGGFDVVIGNPPYIFTREQLTKAERLYYSSHYKLSWEKQNTFMLFMEQLLKLISRVGKGGFIVPNSWLTIESAKILRQYYIPRLQLIVDLNYRVFDKVSMEPCIFVLSGQDYQKKVLTLRIRSMKELHTKKIIPIDHKKWANSNYRIIISDSNNYLDMLDRIIGNSQTIGDVFDVRTGLQAYEKGKGTKPQTANDVKNHIFDRDSWKDENSIKYLQGKDIGRYQLNWSGKWMQYGSWLSQPREINIFNKPRILIREITSEFPKCINATFVNVLFLNNKSILNVLHNQNDEDKIKLLVGILNSRFISLFYKQRAVKSARNIFPKVLIKNLREFPFPINPDNMKCKKTIDLVESMLALHVQIFRTPQEKEALQREIASTDRQIDKLVYDLYGLTEEEIKIVEG